MSFDEFTYDRIEAYLNGKMSSEENNAFEKELLSDKSLSEQVDKHKLVNDLVLENRLLSVKDIFQQEHAKAIQTSSYKKYYYAAIAAVVIAGAAVSVLLYDNNNNNDPQKQTGPTITDTSDFSSGNIQASKSAERIDSKQSFGYTVEPTYLRKQDVQLIEEKNKLNVPSVEKNIQKDQKTETTFTKKTEQQAEENNATKVGTTKDVCADVVIKADIKTSSTCLHESGGNVVVYNIEGGAKPYKIFVMDSHKEFVSNGALPKGIYHVQITDANACEKVYSSVEIAEKDCPIDYSFNPFIDEKWSIESHAASGQLEIYNKGGVLYYKENLDANRENEWTGIGFNNQIMPGYYIFVIRYADGTIKKGSVTIVQ